MNEAMCGVQHEPVVGASSSEIKGPSEAVPVCGQTADNVEIFKSDEFRIYCMKASLRRWMAF